MVPLDRLLCGVIFIGYIIAIVLVNVQWKNSKIDEDIMLKLGCLCTTSFDLRCSYYRLLGGVTVRTMLDLQSRDSRSGHYQVVTTWMGDCLWTDKPSQYNITNTKVNSAPSM